MIWAQNVHPILSSCASFRSHSKLWSRADRTVFRMYSNMAPTSCYGSEYIRPARMKRGSVNIQAWVKHGWNSWISLRNLLLVSKQNVSCSIWPVIEARCNSIKLSDWSNAEDKASDFTKPGRIGSNQPKVQLWHYVCIKATAFALGLSNLKVSHLHGQLWHCQR